MTDATIALAGMAELADKGPDVDMLHQMVQFMAQRLMGKRGLKAAFPIRPGLSTIR